MKDKEKVVGIVGAGAVVFTALAVLHIVFFGGIFGKLSPRLVNASNPDSWVGHTGGWVIDGLQPKVSQPVSLAWDGFWCFYQHDGKDDPREARVRSSIVESDAIYIYVC
jgi:hypothetical protein